MSKSDDMKNMYQANVKPVYPDCATRQYAVNPAGDNWLGVTYDQYSNEQAEDKVMHQNTTPAMGAYNFSGGQYDDSPGKGGFGSYGVTVTDNGQSPNVSRTTVDVSKANVGQES